MIDILKIQHPELESATGQDWTDQKSHEWSPLDICEGKLYIYLNPKSFHRNSVI